MFELYLDGEKKQSDENTKPVHLDAVKVFAGDNFANPLAGKIRNVFIQSKREWKYV